MYFSYPSCDNIDNLELQYDHQKIILIRSHQVTNSTSGEWAGRILFRYKTCFFLVALHWRSFCLSPSSRHCNFLRISTINKHKTAEPSFPKVSEAKTLHFPMNHPPKKFYSTIYLTTTPPHKHPFFTHMFSPSISFPSLKRQPHRRRKKKLPPPKPRQTRPP